MEQNYTNPDLARKARQPAARATTTVARRVMTRWRVVWSAEGGVAREEVPGAGARARVRLALQWSAREQQRRT